MLSLTFVLSSILSYQLVTTTLQSCDSPIYCQGDLLDMVQRSGIFEDSKTFVDMIQINPPNETLQNFEKFKQETKNNPSKDDIRRFIKENFITEGELEPWTPADFNRNPNFLNKIDDASVRNFAREMVAIWPVLARKIRKDVIENPDKHSLISVPNGFIIPGGRFKETYYWDSYWIIEGLLISGMRNTSRGMLENLLSFIERFGFTPNGGRVYYLNRSQPPLLIFMIALYINVTNDIDWLRKNIYTLDRELMWWLTNRTVFVEKNGVNYTLAHYGCVSDTPRPKSYIEDVITYSAFEEESRKKDCYKDIKSSAESGWDFSSRWIFDSQGDTNGTLSDIQTRRVIPVDLNSYLCGAFQEIARLYLKIGYKAKGIQWVETAITWKKSIEIVLYDDHDGIWYDYDVALSRPRKIFYRNNFAPLWARLYSSEGKKYGSRALKYFIDQSLEKYEGGVRRHLYAAGNSGTFQMLGHLYRKLLFLVL